MSATSARSTTRTRQLAVRGMTCASCEQRISKAVGKISGVVDVSVSARRGLATVRTDREVPQGALIRAVRSAGYEVGHDDHHWLTRDGGVWRDVSVALVAVVVLGLALEASGLTSIADRVGGLASSGSVALIVILGVAAGFSTCMALVGGLVLAVSARHAEQHPGQTNRERLRPHLAFNLGRLGGFAVLGAVLGVAGSAFSLSGHLVAILMVVVSLVMAGVGLRLTQMSPRLSRSTSITLPPGLAGALGLDSTAGRYSDGRTALLGAGTFLLPCGFTQAVQVYAMSTGSPLRASLVMTLFAVGTLPGLMGIGGLTALARGAHATRFFRFAGVAVLAFAAVNLSGALGILAPALVTSATSTMPTTTDGDPVDVVSSNVVYEPGRQVLRTRQVATGYEPSGAVVMAGVPVQWEIESTALSCAASLYAPELGIEPRVLEPGTTVIDLTLDEPGTYRYSCGMGMYWGTITAVAAQPAE